LAIAGAVAIVLVHARGRPAQVLHLNLISLRRFVNALANARNAVKPPLSRKNSFLSVTDLD